MALDPLLGLVTHLCAASDKHLSIDFCPSLFTLFLLFSRFSFLGVNSIQLEVNPHRLHSIHIPLSTYQTQPSRPYFLVSEYLILCALSRTMGGSGTASFLKLLVTNFDILAGYRHLAFSLLI